MSLLVFGNERLKAAAKAAALSGNGMRVIVIEGPAGSGKGTVVKELRAICPTMQVSVSATTRQPREGEQNGVQGVEQHVDGVQPSDKRHHELER